MNRVLVLRIITVYNHYDVIVNLCSTVPPLLNFSAILPPSIPTFTTQQLQQQQQQQQQQSTHPMPDTNNPSPISTNPTSVESQPDSTSSNADSSHPVSTSQ